jgi:hypothetical protein
VLHWTESTPNSSIFIVSEPPPPTKASSIVHEHWVDCVSPLHRIDSMSPTFFESTACPLPSLGCLHAPTFLRRLCVNCLSSRRLHDNYTQKPRVPPKSRATCRYPQAAYQPPLLLPTTRSTLGSLEHLRSLEYRTTSISVSTIPPLIAYSTFYHLCVDYSFVSTTSSLVDYS